MFFSYQDNCLIGICWFESRKKKKKNQKLKNQNKSEGLEVLMNYSSMSLLCLSAETALIIP